MELTDILENEVSFVISTLRSRAESHGDNIITKSEIYHVLRGRCDLMLFCRVNLSDIFIAGLMRYLEDVVRFNFIGVEDININTLERIIFDGTEQIERSTLYGTARPLQESGGEGEERAGAE